MNYLSLRQTTIAGGLLAVLGMMHLFVFDRANARLEREMAAINTADRSAATLRRAAGGLETICAQMTDLHAAVDQFESKVPDATQADQSLAELAQIADASSLQMTTSTPLASEVCENQAFAERRTEITLSGDFNAFYSFLLQLEKQTGFVHVVAMNVGRLDGQDGDVSAKLTLELFNSRANDNSVAPVPFHGAVRRISR